MQFHDKRQRGGKAMTPYGVIIDTDIGDDIDDIFALTYCLCNPVFDIKLIIVSSGDNDYKAKLVAYMLQKLNRTDIPIAKSENKPWGCNAQTDALKGFDMNDYRGIIYQDYEDALLRLLSKDKYKFFEFGPCNILSNFLNKNPKLRFNVDLYYMGGSVHRGYINHPDPCAEYNVLMSVDATNNLFATLPNVTLLPVDCCYDLIINGDAYQYLKTMNSTASNLLIEQYKVWDRDYVGGSIKYNPEISSTILYDLIVPIYFLYKEYFEEEYGNLVINELGETSIVPGKNIKIVTKLHNKKEVIKEFINVMRGEEA